MKCITALDVAVARGMKPNDDGVSYSMGEFDRVGISMLGGCANCNASIAAYNAYPAKDGYWRCADCIYDHGFVSTDEFERYDKVVSDITESWHNRLVMVRDRLYTEDRLSADDMRDLAHILDGLLNELDVIKEAIDNQ